MDNFGERFEALLKTEGITDIVAARRMEVSPTQIWRWRNAVSQPHRPTLARMCEVFKVKTDYFEEEE